MVSTLDRKLVRDLLGMKGQALAIALVISSGVATCVMSLAMLHSLEGTLASYYAANRFAGVFAGLERAPEALADRIEAIPGVHAVETRVTAVVPVDVDSFEEPIAGLMVSVPEGRDSQLNTVLIRRGRTVAPGHHGEVVLSEAFAEAHGFSPGDRLHATVNGRRRRFEIVGIGMSPEYIYQIGPGAMMPDFERFAIIWMGRRPLATAYDLEGAFNDVIVGLTPDARPAAVIERLDALLAPYGGLGAYAREDQLSAKFMHEELKQLAVTATVFPTIFLGVAAFLLNVVVARMVDTQREQIAVLKAFGYRDVAIGWHFIKMILVIVIVGVAIGVVEGNFLGHGLAKMYRAFYRFPYLHYELRAGVVALAALVSVAAAILGTLYSVRRAARQPPAEAMRPEPPPRYRETLVERLGLKRFLAQPSRMIIRHLERRPMKSLLTITGIALSYSILMVGAFFSDAVDAMIETQFGLAQREDIAVNFHLPTSRRAVFELESLVGVERGEPFRSVPVRLRNGPSSYRTEIRGVEPSGELYRLLDADLEPIRLPAAGLVLTDYLGTLLGVEVGDRVMVEVLEGGRPVREVRVAALVKQYIGLGGYMNLDALNRLMREGRAISGVYLAVDSLQRAAVFDALSERPRVASTVVRANARQQAYDTMGEQLLTFAFFNTLLATTIAFGVVYNSARLALAERGRELASMRVLGLTRAEISYILLGELALLTLAAMPLGFLLGYGLCLYFVSNLQTDLFRIPLVVEPSTYAFAVTVVLVSAAISALIVRRRLDRLDLVAVLKTKE